MYVCVAKSKPLTLPGKLSPDSARNRFRARNVAKACFAKRLAPPSRLDGGQLRHDAMGRAMTTVSLRGSMETTSCRSRSDAEEAASACLTLHLRLQRTSS